MNSGTKQGYWNFLKYCLVVVLVVLSLAAGASIWAFGWLGMGIFFANEWMNRKEYHRAALLMFLTGSCFTASNNNLMEAAAANALLLTGFNYGWQVWDWWQSRKQAVHEPG